mgnify:FL=1
MRDFFLNKRVVTIYCISGFLFLLAGAGSDSPAFYVGMACFLGIIARIMQAEVHQTKNEGEQ